MKFKPFTNIDEANVWIYNALNITIQYLNMMKTDFYLFSGAASKEKNDKYRKRLESIEKFIRSALQDD